jgi:hypothetical protein
VICEAESPFFSHWPIARVAYDRVGRSLNFGRPSNDLGLAGFSSKPTVPLEICRPWGLLFREKRSSIDTACFSLAIISADA